MSIVSKKKRHLHTWTPGHADTLDTCTPAHLHTVANSAHDRDLELKRLREQVAQLQGDSILVERPRVRQRMDPVPHMPGLILAELA